MKSRYYPIVEEIINNRIDGKVYIRQLTRGDVIRICRFQPEDDEYRINDLIKEIDEYLYECEQDAYEQMVKALKDGD